MLFLHRQRGTVAQDRAAATCGRTGGLTRRRARRVEFEHLERRFTPAVAGNLYTVGTTLVYNNSAVGSTLQFSGADNALHISTTGGTITSTVPGISASSLTNGTAVVPSYVQTIAISGQGSGDTLTVGGWTSSRALILSASTITNAGSMTARGVTETASEILLNGSIDARGGGPIAGAVVFNGPVYVNGPTTIQTDALLSADVTFGGTVLGTNSLTVNAGTSTITALSPINLGGPLGTVDFQAGTLDLRQITTGAGTTLTDSGALTLLGNLISSGPIALYANQTGTGSAGFTQGSYLITTSSSSTTPPAVLIRVNTATGGSGSANIGLITTGTGGQVTIDTQSTLNSGGSILDGNGNQLDVIAGALDALAGPGQLTLNTKVSALAANVASGTTPGNINIDNESSSPLTLGLPGTPSTQGLGVSTTDGNITITNQGTIIVGASPAGGNLGSAGVSAGGTDTSVNLSTTSGSGGNISLIANVTAPTVNLNADAAITDVYTNVSAGATIITPFANLTANTGIGAGAADSSVLVAAASPAATAVLTATTLSGGIFVTDPTSFLTVDSATTNTGAIVLATIAANEDLTIAGTVATADATAGNGVTLSSANNILIVSGQVSAGSPTVPGASDVVFIPANQFDALAGTTIASDHDVIVNSPTSTGDSYELFEGALTAANDITINGGSGSGYESIDFESSATALNGTITIQGATTTGTTQLLVDTGATLTGYGTSGVVIDNPGATTGDLYLTLDGALDAPNGTTTIIGGAGSQLFVTVVAGGSITGQGPGAVQITDTAGSDMNVDVEGSLTALGATGSIQITGSSGNDVVAIGLSNAAVLTAAAGTTIDAGPGSNIDQILPQAGTTFTFANTGKQPGDYDQLVIAGTATYFLDTTSIPNDTIVTFGDGSQPWTVPTATGTGDIDIII